MPVLLVEVNLKAPVVLMVPRESPVLPELLIKMPPSPVVALIVLAWTKILVPLAPMFVPAAWLVLKLTVPVPTESKVEPVWVMLPPFAETVILPPVAVEMLRRAALPVPADALFSVICTALVLLSEVVMEPPAAMLKLMVPVVAPLVFEFRVTVPEALSGSEMVKPVEACIKRAPLVKAFLVASVPPLLSRVKAPVPVLIVLAGKVKVPEEITVSGTLATLKVGAAKVMLPVLDT